MQDNEIAVPENQDERMEKDIQTLGLNAPRVSVEYIDYLMGHVTYETHVVANTTTTVAVALLNMGTSMFTLAIERTACVDASNFNAELGAKYAIESAAMAARNKLWELEGYVLAKLISEGGSITVYPTEPNK